MCQLCSNRYTKAKHQSPNPKIAQENGDYIDILAKGACPHS